MSAAGGSDTRLRRLARLFAGLRRGEEISRDVSWRQAALAGDPRMRDFLLLQSRQEARHAAAFAAARALTGPRERCPAPLDRALADYAARLHADLDARRLAASLVGLQGLLEGLGAVALRTPRSELAGFGARYVPFRDLLLRQEEAHHRLGLHWLARLAASEGPAAQAALLQACRDYADLGEAVAEASVAIFDGFDLDQRDYLEAARREIDAVRRGEPLRARSVPPSGARRAGPGP